RRRSGPPGPRAAGSCRLGALLRSSAGARGAHDLATAVDAVARRVALADQLRGARASGGGVCGGEQVGQGLIVAARLEPLDGAARDRRLDDLAEPRPVLDLVRERAVGRRGCFAGPSREPFTQAYRDAVGHDLSVALCY